MVAASKLPVAHAGTSETFDVVVIGRNAAMNAAADTIAWGFSDANRIARLLTHVIPVLVTGIQPSTGAGAS